MGAVPAAPFVTATPGAWMAPEADQPPVLWTALVAVREVGLVAVGAHRVPVEHARELVLDARDVPPVVVAGWE